MIWGAAGGLIATPLIHLLAQRTRHVAARQQAAGWALLTIGSVIIGAAAMLIRPIAAAGIYATVLALLLVAAAVDATEQRLPNVLTIGGGGFALAGLSAVTAVTGAGSPWRAMAGGAIFGGWTLLAALLARDGYGLGDVKLAAACGVLASWLSWTALAVAILATQIAIAIALLHAKARGRQHAPLGPAFVVGLLVAIAIARS